MILGASHRLSYKTSCVSNRRKVKGYLMLRTIVVQDNLPAVTSDIFMSDIPRIQVSGYRQLYQTQTSLDTNTLILGDSEFKSRVRV